MRHAIIALALMLPASALGAEPECERWHNGALIESAFFQLDGTEIAITTKTSDYRDRTKFNTKVEQVEYHSVEHANGNDGPLISVAVARQPSAGPSGPLEFSPMVYYVDWGAAKATWLYNAGDGEVEKVSFDICKRIS